MRLPPNRLVCLDLKGVSKRAPGWVCTNLRPGNLLKARILILGAPQITVSYRAARRVSYYLIIGVSYFRIRGVRIFDLTFVARDLSAGELEVATRAS